MARNIPNNLSAQISFIINLDPFLIEYNNKLRTSFPTSLEEKLL